MRRFLVVVATVLLLSGCSVTPAPTPEPTPDLPAETSTVAQWASLVAKQTAAWDDWQSDWDSRTCTALAAAEQAGITCRITLMSAMYMTQTSALTFQGAMTPGVPAFIADAPPAEIEGLYADTIAASEAAQSASAAWDAAGCGLEPADVCGKLSVDFSRAIDGLRSEFAGWAPYM